MTSHEERQITGAACRGKDSISRFHALPAAVGFQAGGPVQPVTLTGPTGPKKCPMTALSSREHPDPELSAPDFGHRQPVRNPTIARLPLRAAPVRPRAGRVDEQRVL